MTKEELKQLLTLSKQGDKTAMITFSTYLFDNEKYEQSFPWLQELANNGNADAQFKLGKMYDLGLYVDEDEYAAEKWYMVAAKQNHLAAINNLAYLYEDGHFDIIKKRKAKKLYLKAAKQGFAISQYNVGLYYLYPKYYSRKSTKKAFYWIEKAAQQRYDFAIYKLSDMYYDGIGVENDYHKAYALLNTLSSDFKHNMEVQFKKAICWFYGRGTNRDLERAFLEIQQLAHKGHSEADVLFKQWTSYKLNEKDKAIIQEDAFHECLWHKNLHESGSIIGSYQYALCLYYGKGCLRNLRIAKKIFSKVLSETKTMMNHWQNMFGEYGAINMNIVSDEKLKNIQQYYKDKCTILE